MSTKTIAILIGIASILGCLFITRNFIKQMREIEIVEWCLNEGSVNNV